MEKRGLVCMLSFLALVRAVIANGESQSAAKSVEQLFAEVFESKSSEKSRRRPISTQRNLADVNDDDSTNEQCSQFLVSFLEGTTDAHDTCEGIMNAYTAAGEY